MSPRMRSIGLAAAMGVLLSLGLAAAGAGEGPVGRDGGGIDTGEGPARYPNDAGAGEVSPDAAPAPEPADAALYAADAVRSIDAAGIPEDNATEIKLTGPLVAAPIGGSLRSPGTRTAKVIILRTGHTEVGGELAPIVGRANALRRFDFGALVLFRARARHAFARWLELSVGTDLLAQKPTDLQASVWQGTSVGLRVPFAHSFAACSVGRSGSLYDERGSYWQTESMLQMKHTVSQPVRFDVAMGNAVTLLQFDEQPSTPFWIDEFAGHVELDLGEYRGGYWLGIDYRIPYASGPHRLFGRAAPRTYLEPATRFSVQAGGILVNQNNWDMYGFISVIHCGDWSKPATTLPILDGGFDQVQVVLGVAHRFMLVR